MDFKKILSVLAKLKPEESQTSDPYNVVAYQVTQKGEVFLVSSEGRILVAVPVPAGEAHMGIDKHIIEGVGTLSVENSLAKLRLCKTEALTRYVSWDSKDGELKGLLRFGVKVLKDFVAALDALGAEEVSLYTRDTTGGPKNPLYFEAIKQDSKSPDGEEVLVAKGAVCPMFWKEAEGWRL